MKNEQNGFGIVGIFVAIIVVAAVAGSAFFVLSNSDSDESSESTTSSSENGGSGDQIDASQEVESQNISASINEQVDMSNGYSFVVTGVERGWTTKKDRTIPTPDPGSEYVAVNVTITNNSDEEITVGGSSIALVDAGGNEFIEAPSTYQLEENTVLLKKLAPGESVTGQVVYSEVPQGAELSFVYESSYLVVGSSEEIDLKATVAL